MGFQHLYTRAMFPPLFYHWIEILISFEQEEEQKKNCLECNVTIQIMR